MKKITFVELIVTLIIIFIFAIIAFPRFKNIVNIKKETETKTNLLLIKTAIAEYYEANEKYPEDISNEKFLTNYLGELPNVMLDHIHKNSNQVSTNKINDTGGWHYNPKTGRVRVNCKHKDTKGQIISSW